MRAGCSSSLSPCSAHGHTAGEEDPMRRRTAHTLDRVLQSLADGATWVLFRGVGVRV